MDVLHANWSEQRLHLWAESGLAARRADGVEVGEAAPTRSPESAIEHPFAVGSTALRERLASLGLGDTVLDPEEGWLTLALPCLDGRPEPSPRLAADVDIDADENPITRALGRVRVPTVPVSAPLALRALALLDAAALDGQLTRGDALRYFIAVAGFASELLVAQRFVPTLIHQAGGELRGVWRLWLHDESTRRQLSALVRAMPPAARSVVDTRGHQPWPILQSMLNEVADATVRRILLSNDLAGAVRGWRGEQDLGVAWMRALLSRRDELDLDAHDRLDLLRGVRDWLGRLTDIGQKHAFRLALVLREPAESDRLAELADPGDDVLWPLEFHLQAPDDPSIRVDAERIWSSADAALLVEGRRVDQPQETLLSELARASKIYPQLEGALAQAKPTGIALTTRLAYSFLRDVRPLLEESGIDVGAPEWWGQPQSRLAARLHVDSPDLDENDEAGLASPTAVLPGLEAVVDYHWQIALGDQLLTEEEFRRLARQKSPLVRIRGRWVEIRPDDLARARAFLEKRLGGQIKVRDALRLAYSSSAEQTGLPILGLNATGWVSRLFGEAASDEGLVMLPQPSAFKGSLRPYQLKGLSWLAFLQRFGLGACLADDMGLGKTIQLIALLLWEREKAEERSAIGPTLLVVPTSVVSNWVREIKRFAPDLQVLVHHGIGRLSGQAFIDETSRHDVVITTYALAYRDREHVGKVEWWRICLDEAQNIKNPSAKQTSAIRQLESPRRVALTGTPVENRLSELWSIMEFCNPGYLGSSGEFRRQFAIPVERYRDPVRAGQLRDYVRPFVLRRLKTDPNVISDLPDKLEHKVYCQLTAEQARLYQQIVREGLDQADRTEGMQRRSLVLATIIRLKQICNHPSQYLASVDGPSERQGAQASRSGKATRLLEMLEEVLAEGDASLVFTQFREMGHLLVSMIQRHFGVEALFLHGGTPAAKRQQLIDRFQRRDGSAPVFVLSLKAGGFGLNLTAANHVFHFDRWWNPAVENQATDRAFRIGQTRNVQVHKFVCSGTLEERIDQMLEEKIELAENIIGSGEQWLTELSTAQLREVLTLRREAVGDDAVEELEEEMDFELDALDDDPDSEPSLRESA